ncbi:MAG: ZIP family metal transporter [Oscillospiraceae bacterium]|nr:ZIP family metal transporter [Oscillospiraceae bacterium]
MEILLLTALVGIVGMGLGGLISALLGTVSPRAMSWLLSFAGGVMISVVSFKMIPASIALAGVTTAVIGLALGVAAVAVLSHLLDKIAKKGGEEVHICHTRVCHEHKRVERPTLVRSGIIMLVALSLHKLPEGIAIGAAGTYDIRMGIVLAVAAALHCIPEGMAIGAPLIGGGMSKQKAVALTALGGTPTIIGGIIGMLIGGISDTALALALCGASGTMLYVVFGEVLPQSSQITKSRLTTFAAILGILVGLLMTFALADYSVCALGHQGCTLPHNYLPQRGS